MKKLLSPSIVRETWKNFKLVSVGGVGGSQDTSWGGEVDERKDLKHVNNELGFMGRELNTIS